MTLLLDLGADIDFSCMDQGKTMLLDAIQRGYTE